MEEEKVVGVGGMEDHNHKLEAAKGFDEIMGASLVAASVGGHHEHDDDIEVVDHEHHLQHHQLHLHHLEHDGHNHHHHHHHHPSDDDLHHLLPLALAEDHGHGHEHHLEEDVDEGGHNNDAKHEHQEHVRLVIEEDAAAAVAAAVAAGTTQEELTLLSPPPGEHLAGAQPVAAAEDDVNGTPKIVKRGRGGRRAGAGRKRKSQDTTKADAADASLGRGSAATTSAKPIGAAPQPGGSPLAMAGSTMGRAGGEANAGSGGGGMATGPSGALNGQPSPHKKKKLASSPALVDDALEAGGYGKKSSRLLKFGKTILYVKEVEATVEFYERAFGLRRRFVHETKQYAELETGATALAFASNDLARNNLAHVEFRPNDINAHPPGMEIALSSCDVHRDYKRAVEAGARSVSLPKTLPWGQAVAYVRDLNGVLVEIASELKTPLKK